MTAFKKIISRAVFIAYEILHPWLLSSMTAVYVISNLTYSRDCSHSTGLPQCLLNVWQRNTIYGRCV